MDCGGHGTHCSGIIGGNDGKVLGVAPGVTFGAYRVFGCDGSASTEVIIAGLERAYLEGMDIINLSLGQNQGWKDAPDAVVASRIADSGVIVVAAQGNEGAQGLWHASNPVSVLFLFFRF